MLYRYGGSAGVLRDNCDLWGDVWGCRGAVIKITIRGSWPWGLVSGTLRDLVA